MMPNAFSFIAGSLLCCGAAGVGHARETGYYPIEGRDYMVKYCDVIRFKFSV